MKIIISESQFEQIIPSSVRRRLSEISDVLYVMLNNTDIGEEAEEYSEDDYVDYVIEIFKKLVGDKIRQFWKEQKDRKESMFEFMDDIVQMSYGGFNITDDDSYLRYIQKR